jgi:hypothetical protein
MTTELQRMNGERTLTNLGQTAKKNPKRRIQRIRGLFVDTVRGVVIGLRGRGFVIVHIIRWQTVNDAADFDDAKICWESVRHDAVD